LLGWQSRAHSIVLAFKPAFGHCDPLIFNVIFDIILV
jgi:hypothetical protein